MTKVQVAKYNRLSTKCHAWVKQSHPQVLEALAAQVESEWKRKQYRRVSRHDLENAFKPSEIVPSTPMSEKEQNEWFDAYWAKKAAEQAERG